MADHQRFLDIAVRLIAQHGREIVLQELSLVPKDPLKPWLGTSEQPINHTGIMGVMVPYSGNEFGSNWNNNGVFKEVAEVILVAGQPVSLDDCKLIQDEGATYKIAWVQKLRPANLTVLYAFGIER